MGSFILCPCYKLLLGSLYELQACREKKEEEKKKVKEKTKTNTKTRPPHHRSPPAKQYLQNEPEMAYSWARRQSASSCLCGGSARILPMWLRWWEQQLETSLCHHVPCLTANSLGMKEGWEKLFTDSPALHAKFRTKYTTHSIQKGLELMKNKSKGVSKINPIKTSPFTAVAKRWEESNNSNKEIIWQWIRIYNDSIQIYFDERECNYWCSCHT